MKLRYDLFEKPPKGKVLWHGAVSGLKAARKALTALARRTANECVLLDLKNHRCAGRVDRRTKKQRSKVRRADAQTSGLDIASRLTAMDLIKLEAYLNRKRIKVIFMGLEVALGLADLALASENQGNQDRNRAHALKSYFQIRDKFLPLCTPNHSDRFEIAGKLDHLQQRLELLGETFA